MEITSELVSRYVKGARPFAESATEQLAIKLAARINSPPKRVRMMRRNPYRPSAKKLSKPEAQVRSWQDLIMKELHTAFCTRSRRYQKYVAAFSDNVHLLIGGIAVYVAGQIGVAVAIVAALVAALLRVVCTMGVSVFCRRFEAGWL